MYRVITHGTESVVEIQEMGTLANPVGKRLLTQGVLLLKHKHLVVSSLPLISL